MKTRRGVRYPGTGLTGSCEPPRVCCESNPGSLEGQSVLLTTELATKAPTLACLCSNLSSSWSAPEMTFTQPFEASLWKYTIDRNPFVAVEVDSYHLNHPLKPHLPESEGTLSPLYRMSQYFHITYAILRQLKIVSWWLLMPKAKRKQRFETRAMPPHLESGGKKRSLRMLSTRTTSFQIVAVEFGWTHEARTWEDAEGQLYKRAHRLVPPPFLFHTKACICYILFCTSLSLCKVFWEPWDHHPNCFSILQVQETSVAYMQNNQWDRFPLDRLFAVFCYLK